MIYNADGAIRVTIVDGNTHTGLYAQDGSLNVVEVDGSAWTGLYHQCGAFNVVLDDSSPLRYNPCGAINVTELSSLTGSLFVEAVSGSFGGSSSPEISLYWFFPTFTYNG